MRVVAAIPAGGLLAGAAAGLFVPDVPRLFLCALLIAGSVLAWRAWHVADPRLLTVAVVSAFFAGGALLAADAWQRAWRPSLWTAFEALARVQRRDADTAGRRLPLDDEAFAVVRGRLRADAALTPSGVALSVDVEGLEGREGLDPQEGGAGRGRGGGGGGGGGAPGGGGGGGWWGGMGRYVARPFQGREWRAASPSPSPDRWPPIAWANGAPDGWSECRRNYDARRDI